MGLWTDGCGCGWDWWESGQVTDKRWAPGPDRQKGGLADGWADLCQNRCIDEGMEPRWIGIEKWVGWQTNRQTDRWIGCEIDKNRWGVGQKVALGQQVGGISGQLIVGGDGSPRWVVITRSGVHVHEKSTYG